METAGDVREGEFVCYSDCDDGRVILIATVCWHNGVMC